MSKFEMFFALLVLVADTFLIMSFTSGGTLTEFQTSVALFVNGLAIGDIFYVLVFQDAVRRKFKKEE